MPKEFRLHLTGEAAQLGHVYAIDVAHLLEGMERAVARAAEQIVGRTPGLTGRRGRDIEQATRFRLKDLQGGSITPVLELPSDAADGPLSLDVESLGEQAIALALSTLEGTISLPTVAEALARTGEEVGLGTRYDSIALSFDETGASHRTVILDQSATLRLRKAAAPDLDQAPQSLVGTLVEADFERMTARLRTSASAAIRVAFDESLSDAIQRALRHQAEFDGLVAYEETTGRATGIELRRVVRTEQMLLGVAESDFWNERTIPQLAADQGIDPATSSRGLSGEDPSDEELDALFRALGI